MFVAVLTLSLLAINCDKTLQDQSQDESRQLISQFYEEAPAAWKEYEARARQLQGTERLEVINFKDHSRDEISLHTIKQNASCLSKLLAKSDGRQVLTVVNGKYAFQLERPNEERGWVLKHTDPTVSDGVAFDDRQSLIRDTVSCTSAAPLWMQQFSMLRMSDVLLSDRCQITSGALENTKGQTLAKLEFTFEPDYAHEIPIISGSVTLDPARMWIPVQCILALKQDDGRHGVIVTDYQFEQGGIPVIAQFSCRTYPDSKTVAADKLAFERKATFDLHPGNPADSEFTLAAFGLEDMNWTVGEAPPTGVRWWLWLAIGGLVALVLAILAGMSAAKRRQTA